MGLLSSKKALIGLALMVVGTLAFLPGVAPTVGPAATWVLVLAAALLTYGTYLVGTSGGGRPV
jgi:hypothetical protein